jgi:purine-binding chemotaxis protein CheW
MRAASDDSQIGDLEQIVVFDVAGQRFALTLAVVERVERAVAITALPEAPAVIAGVIDVHGDLIPVITMRRQWNLPERPLQLGDQLLIARGSRRRYALLIDGVAEVVDCDVAAIVPAESFAAQTDSLRGAINVGDDIVFIYDLDHFLSLDAERALDEALGHV